MVVIYKYAETLRSDSQTESINIGMTIFDSTPDLNWIWNDHGYDK